MCDTPSDVLGKQLVPGWWKVPTPNEVDGLGRLISAVAGAEPPRALRLRLLHSIAGQTCAGLTAPVSVDSSLRRAGVLTSQTRDDSQHVYPARERNPSNFLRTLFAFPPDSAPRVSLWFLCG